MFDWTDDEARVIDEGLEAIQLAATELGDQVTFDLLKVRTQIWQELRTDNQPAENSDSLRSAAAQTIRFAYAGMLKKREIGEDNDTFYRTGLYRSEIEAAYRLGQEMVRYNRLIELSFWNKIRGRKGPISRGLLDGPCQRVVEIIRAREDALE
jgi:hypothetical protein